MNQSFYVSAHALLIQWMLVFMNFTNFGGNLPLTFLAGPGKGGPEKFWIFGGDCQKKRGAELAAGIKN